MEDSFTVVETVLVNLGDGKILKKYVILENQENSLIITSDERLTLGIKFCFERIIRQESIS